MNCDRGQWTSPALAAGLLLGIFWAGPVLARPVHGPCQMRDGICYQTLDEVVDQDQARRYLEAPPSTPRGTLTRDLSTGQVKRSFSPQAGPTWSDGAESWQAEPQNRVLSILEQPWLNDHYRTMVKIEARFPTQPAGTISVCSGTMIGSHTVLTAGHCIYSHDSGGWAEWAYVYPAMAGYHLTPFGEAQASQLTSTSWWVDDEDHNGDTAIIQLAENVGDLTGWPALKWDYSSLAGSINSGGYPADEGYDGHWLYFDGATIEDVTDNLVCHSAHTIKGMSGGPGWLYYADSQERFVTAVNSFCYIESGQCCMARYIDLVDQQRQDSENEAAGQVGTHWLCDLAWFSTLDGCNCQCGMWDPDCEQDGQTVVGCAGGERCVRPDDCVCDPQCTGLDCGPDGCGGSCGTCAQGNQCEQGLCSCVPQCAGRQCGDDLCGGSCGQCPDGANCENGSCSCVADCTGLECGSDGCGGTCGTCTDGLTCVAGVCNCLPSCSQNSCGPDGCGGSCGMCAGDQECIEGRCVCTYNCQGRQCGSDGCGGSCGACAAGELCNDGRCLSEDDLGKGSSCGCASQGTAADGLWLLFLGLGLTWIRRASRQAN